MKNIKVLLITKPDFDVPGIIGGLAKLTQIKKEFEPTSTEIGLKIMKSLIDMGHTSLLECADFGFLFLGTSRVFLAQITRHRLASYTSGSQQYQNHDDFPYVIPESIESDPSSRAIFESMMVSIDDAYQLLKENGIPKDDARYVLPGAAANHLYAKFNLREILGPIMTQRLCKRNTPEMLYNMQQMIHLMCLAGFENCVIMGGCSCVVGGGCDQGRMSCKKPYNSWEEMIYGN